MKQVSYEDATVLWDRWGVHNFGFLVYKRLFDPKTLEDFLAGLKRTKLIPDHGWEILSCMRSILLN